jgi:hypothetical protein
MNDKLNNSSLLVTTEKSLSVSTGTGIDTCRAKREHLTNRKVLLAIKIDPSESTGTDTCRAKREHLTNRKVLLAIKIDPSESTGTNRCRAKRKHKSYNVQS